MCPIALKRCRGAILGDGMRPCSDKWEFGEAGSLVASRGQLAAGDERWIETVLQSVKHDANESGS